MNANTLISRKIENISKLEIGQAVTVYDNENNPFSIRRIATAPDGWPELDYQKTFIFGGWTNKPKIIRIYNEDGEKGFKELKNAILYSLAEDGVYILFSNYSPNRD